MGQLETSNLNLNLNLNLGAAGATATAAGPPTRINTQELRKLADRTVFPFQKNDRTGELADSVLGFDPKGAKRIQYREFWDGDLQSYVYLNEFVSANPGWL